MKIGPLHQPKAIVEGQPAQSTPPVEPEKKAAAADSVEISTGARERLALLADQARLRIDSDDPASPTAAAENDADLRQDKIRLARARIRSGYYNQPEIKQDIAAKLADNINERPPDNPETSA